MLGPRNLGPLEGQPELLTTEPAPALEEGVFRLDHGDGWTSQAQARETSELCTQEGILVHILIISKK